VSNPAKLPEAGRAGAAGVSSTWFTIGFSLVKQRRAPIGDRSS
jgi:hypothetical protein